MLENERDVRWVNASLNFKTTRPFLTTYIQGAGALDCRLIAEDLTFAAHETTGDTRVSDEEKILQSIKLTERVHLSYLWVLGAYEIIRTVSQHLDSTQHPQRENARTVKHKFERIRIPLAKMEAARKHPSDSPIAYPVFNPETGISWQLGETTFVPRLKLADLLLQFVEDFNESLSSTDHDPQNRPSP